MAIHHQFLYASIISFGLFVAAILLASSKLMFSISNISLSSFTSFPLFFIYLLPSGLFIFFFSSFPSICFLGELPLFMILLSSGFFCSVAFYFVGLESLLLPRSSFSATNASIFSKVELIFYPNDI